MNVNELPAYLREIADRIEGADLPPDHSIDVKLDVSQVETREELAKWAAFAGDPLTVNTSESNSWLSRYSYFGKRLFGIAIWFTPGLLGGKVVEVRKDDLSGLQSLMAECSPVSEKQFDDALQNAGVKL